jgi:hypothetical protein
MADDSKSGNGTTANPFTQLFGAFNAFAAGNSAKTWETWINGQLDRFVRSDQFLGQMGKALEGSMLFKAQMDRMFEQSLRSMRMPALSDFEAVHKRLDEMERRLDTVIDRLDAQAPRPAAKKAAPAKKAPAKKAPAKKAPAKKAPVEATAAAPAAPEKAAPSRRAPRKAAPAAPTPAADAPEAAAPKA